MKRLTEWNVLAGSLERRLRAAWPTRTVPSGRKDTTLGVVRRPSSSGTITGLPSTITATALLVVPRSIPQMDARGATAAARARRARAERVEKRRAGRHRDASARTADGEGPARCAESTANEDDIARRRGSSERARTCKWDFLAFAPPATSRVSSAVIFRQTIRVARDRRVVRRDARHTATRESIRPPSTPVRPRRRRRDRLPSPSLSSRARFPRRLLVRSRRPIQQRPGWWTRRSSPSSSA